MAGSKVLLAATMVAASALAGCSGSGSGLTTASILGGSTEASAAQAKPIQPQDRAIQVGAVSARAQKCGYNFDAAKLRANYLASEAAGLDGGQLAQLGEIYDKTARAVAVAIQSDQSFCTDAKTKQIKADLTRHLAGDFTPERLAGVEKSGGIFEIFTPDAGSRETVNPEWIRNSRAPKTIRTEQ